MNLTRTDKLPVNSGVIKDKGNSSHKSQNIAVADGRVGEDTRSELLDKVSVG